MPDIHDALAQLERRLSDLKRELVRMAEEPLEPNGLTSPGSQLPPRSREPAPTFRTSEAAGPSRPSSPTSGQIPRDPAPPPATAGSGPRTVPPRPAPPPEALSGAPARDPEEIVAQAEAEAVRVLTHAHDHVAELKAQVDQLQSFRMRLLTSAHELVSRFQEELTQLGQPPSVPDSPAPAPETAQAPEPPPWPTSFEGIVTIIVPWISRLETVQVLEDSLTRVPAAQSVYLRGYHRGEVRLELVLGETVDLIAELNRVLPYAFALESARPDEIVMRLDRAGGTRGG